MGKLSDRVNEVGDDDVERLRSVYLALGPGFPAEAFALFEHEGGDGGGVWCRLAPHAKPRFLTATELASTDLFGLLPSWEVMRVEPRRLTARSGIITVTGSMYCRPRGTWENIRVPVLHAWTMCQGKALRFQNLLDDIELRRADGHTRCGA